MNDHLHFLLPGIVAKAIDIDSAARYPTAPNDAPERMYSLEARRPRRVTYYSVHCGAAVAPLIIADIERVRAASETVNFREECDRAIVVIRAELERPAPSQLEDVRWFRAATGDADVR